MDSQQLADRISQLALQKKGHEVTIMNLQKLSDAADFFVMVTCESDLHVKAVADYIETELKGANIRLWHKEGYSNLNWVLLDFIDVVVHIFRRETRAYYALEKLWADANITLVKDDAPIRSVPGSTT